jgi:hypothetical protein
MSKDKVAKTPIRNFVLFFAKRNNSKLLSLVRLAQEIRKPKKKGSVFFALFGS